MVTGVEDIIDDLTPMAKAHRLEFDSMCKAHDEQAHFYECVDLLQEECAEVIVILSKIRRFGISSYSPFDPEQNPNHKLLTQEIGDVLALIDLLLETEHSKLVYDDIQQAKEAKLKKLERWMHYPKP